MKRRALPGLLARSALAALAALAAPACAARRPPPAAAAGPSVPPPALSAPAAPAAAEWRPRGEGLCPLLCQLRPALASNEQRLSLPAFKSTEGARFEPSSLRGKVLVVHLWKHPVTEIMQELPELAKLSRRVGAREDIALFTVSIDEDAVRAREALRQLLDGEHPFPFVIGEEAASIATRLGPEQLPTTWVLDGRGVVRARFDGPQSWGGEPFARLLDGIARGEGCSLEIADGRVTAPAGQRCSP